MPDEDQLELRVPAEDSVDSLRQLLSTLHETNITVEDISIHTPDLDDVFLAVTASHAARHSDSPAAWSLESKGAPRQ